MRGSRCLLSVLGLALGALPGVAQTAGAAADDTVASAPARDTDWWVTTGNRAAHRYSPLGQIDRANVASLEVAWRWSSPDNDILSSDEKYQSRRMAPRNHSSTPLKVGNRLYTITGMSQAVAVDPGTGETLWTYDPKAYEAGRPTNLGFTHRGAAFWRDPERESDPGRLIYGGGDAILRAVDVLGGEPIGTFGSAGAVDLTQGLRREFPRSKYAVSSPVILCRDVAIVGSSISDGPTHPLAPPGDVRGFDARTGEQLWAFHSVAQPGEVGHETWEDESWRETGNTNVWTLLSADEELGLVYLPFGTPTNDWYGGHRKGDNLFAESLVAVDCETGERRWHFQMVHHGLWDWDLPTPPILGDFRIGDRQVEAAMQLSKQGFLYVFDRQTGEPVWPIEERLVPQSGVPGEKTSLTQPFPTQPPAYERQGMTLDDLIDFTPEIYEEAKEILNQYDFGPLFTPPSERGTISMPGYGGGSNWQGGAWDPEAQMLFVPSFTWPIVMTVRKPDPTRSSFDYVGSVKSDLRGPFDLPLVKPPYSRITAYDMTRGAIAWVSAVGDGPRRHPKLRHLDLPPLGSGSRVHVLATRTLLFAVSGQSHAFRALEEEARRELAERPAREVADPQVATEERDWRQEMPMLRAFDKATGDLIWQYELPYHADSTPATFLHDGRQYLVFSMGARGFPLEMIAFRLPG